jgi:hypothetical protein
MFMHDKRILFAAGMVCCTPAALLKLLRFSVSGANLLERHTTGDFGNLCEEDKARNTEAAASGGRVFSSYEIAPDVKVWVITEADRSATTILLPSEY